MGKKIKQIDAYIAKSAEFAKPILKHIRELVHKACPDVEEKIKWSFPHFDYKGEMMFSMAAFKQHCACGFWKAALMGDNALLENARSEQSMGNLGRIGSLQDLPSDKKMTAYIKKAMQLNDAGIKLAPKITPNKKNIEIPVYFLQALKKNKSALTIFQAASYAYKKEYILWVTEAKTEATRLKRIETAVEWIAEKKGRNWKYER